VGQSSGRPQSLSEEQMKLVVDLVFEERGRAKVTVKYCKQMLRFFAQAQPPNSRACVRGGRVGVAAAPHEEACSP